MELRRSTIISGKLHPVLAGRNLDNVPLVERIIRPRGMVDHVASSSTGISGMSGRGNGPNSPTTVMLDAGNGNSTQGSSMTSDASNREDSTSTGSSTAQLNPVPFDLTPVDLPCLQVHLPLRLPLMTHSRALHVIVGMT